MAELERAPQFEEAKTVGRDELLARLRREPKLVRVGDMLVEVMPLSADELDNLLKEFETDTELTFGKKLVAQCVTALSEDDLDALGAADVGVLGQLIEAVTKVNGLGDDSDVNPATFREVQGSVAEVRARRKTRNTGRRTRR